MATRVDFPRWLPQGIALLGGLLLLLQANPFRFVENGENLVVFTWFGGVSRDPLPPGFHLVIPLITETVAFDVRTQAMTWKDNDPEAYAPRLIALSRDGQEMRMEMTLNYRVVDAPQVLTTLGLEYNDRLEPIVRSVVASEAAGFAAQDLYSTQRETLQTRIQEQIAGYLQPYGIAVQNFLLRDVAFDPDFVAAIEAKTIAENQLARKAFEIEQAREDAKSIIAQAQAEAGSLAAKATALTQNPDYLKVLQSQLLGETLETLVLGP
ncbi:MAG: prohibitin family protein [Thermostichales cyanobacterium SZTDM-1c_bins_54]